MQKRFKVFNTSFSHAICSVVEFASLSDMKTAIEKLDDTELNGRRIRLVEDRRGGRSGKLIFTH